MYILIRGNTSTNNNCHDSYGSRDVEIESCRGCIVVVTLNAPCSMVAVTKKVHNFQTLINKPLPPFSILLLLTLSWFYRKQHGRWVSCCYATSIWGRFSGMENPELPMFWIVYSSSSLLNAASQNADNSVLSTNFLLSLMKLFSGEPTSHETSDSWEHTILHVTPSHR